MNLTEEQLWLEEQMSKNEFFNRYYNSESDNKEIERRKRIFSKDELLKEFSEDAEKKLMRSGLFNNIFMSIMQGANRYEIIETLVDMVEKYQKDNEELLKYSTKPAYKTEL